jgi:hypothetical protein
MSAPALDPGQLARLLPVEAAEAAIAELEAQGLGKQAEAMQKALDAKRAELEAIAKTKADAEEKARQDAIAEAQREFDEAHAEYEAARDTNLERWSSSSPGSRRRANWPRRCSSRPTGSSPSASSTLRSCLLRR